MKKVFLLLLIVCSSWAAFAQEDSIDVKIEAAYDNREFDQIITKYGEKGVDYSAESLFYIGMAYYMKSQDEKCLQFMDRCIAKNDSFPNSYYIKGETLNSMSKFAEAIPLFEKAISLDDSDADYYTGMGDSYLNLEKPEKALEFYLKATQKEKIRDRPYAMLGHVYSDLGQKDKALAAFYAAKEEIANDSDYYFSVMFNIGLYEYLNKNYDKSELAYKTLHEQNPDDYELCEKLIQVYYGKKEYDKAKPYKDKLYEGYEAGKLSGELADMFCFDQFEWNGQPIFAFENFKEVKNELYYKHVFYVVDEEGNIKSTIQTENSPVSVELGGPKYALGMNQGPTHYTFFFIEENFKYDELKENVFKILNKEISASSSSTVSVNVSEEDGEKSKKKKKKKKKSKKKK